jgi:hypothetical protein
MATTLTSSSTGASISTISTSGAGSTEKGLLGLWAGTTPSCVAIWIRFGLRFGSTTTLKALGRDFVA